MSDFELVTADPAILPLVQHLRYRVYCAEKQFAMPGADHDNYAGPHGRDRPERQ